uniref:US22 family protein n=1 Tax=Gasterosteus aculeatus aculeatus TaxID=481459 RepID=G3NZZ0_GASAC
CSSKLSVRTSFLFFIYPGYLSSMLELVLEHKNERIPLKNPAGATLTIGNVDETIYRGKMDVLNGWNKFYLPDIVSMQVLGVVTGTSCPGDHLVLMTCEDEQLYAYDGEELHVVASSLEQLRNEGIEYPADKSYYKGEAFPNTVRSYMRKGAVGRRLDQEHRKLVTATKSEFLKNLRSIQTGSFVCCKVKIKIV